MRLTAVLAAALLAGAAVSEAHAASGGFQSGGRGGGARTGAGHAHAHSAIPAAGRFAGRNRFRGGIGVPAFVPYPDLLGLPFYDGFEYPYFTPGAIYPDEVYGIPPSYLPPPVYDTAPPVAAAQSSGSPVWYYCQDPMGYYPYVRDCNGAWQAVPASVLPPPTPQ